MFRKVVIQSHKGEYTAIFNPGAIEQLNDNLDLNAVYIIDSNICKLYANRIDKILSSSRVIIIHASEKNKSLDKMPGYVDELLSLNIKRGEPLIAIGGGIIQDITCFLATTLMRGLSWSFYPTTLLAQVDSCIGSKSSINSGEFKNILGTFLPPKEVFIDVDFLKTLQKPEIFSGLGEMLKVHAINNPESFNLISKSYEKILDDPIIMENFIFNSLSMKKKLIEIDEFDQGLRNVMNYGHSFGHAIESATNYEIPHGVAVTIGMDIANFVAAKLGISNTNTFERMHPVLHKNCKNYRDVHINLDLLLNALSKDKKNSSLQLKLIFPDKSGVIGIGSYDNNDKLKQSLAKYFEIYGITIKKIDPVFNNSMASYEHLLTVAKEAAVKATQALDSMDDISFRYVYDNDFPREMKAEVDIKLHEMILDCLKPSGIPILSEESSGHSKFNNKGLYWLVDPLDGTVNFIRGTAPCAVSIALWLNNQPVFGVISEYPSLRLAWGGSLFGSFIEDEPLHVSVIENKSQAVLCTGFPSRFEFSKVSIDSFLNMTSSFGKVRMLGAASLSLLQVANGSADAYLEEDIMIWDVGAGLAIIEGAGGNIKILPGRFQLSQKIIASNGLIELE